MTKQQRKTIFKEFYNNKTASEQWQITYEKTRDTYKWEKEYDLITSVFDKHKSKWCVCGEIGISGRTYDYWLANILGTAFMWAKEFKLI